jgi:hypothetical protein
MSAAAQVTERYVASSEVHRIVRAEIKRFTDDVLAPGIAQAIGELVRESEARLVARIAALEDRMKEFRFVGQWAEFKTYKAGNFCSMGGQIFHANTDTQSRPGTDSTWTLACKSGRDGRDGKHATPSEPPTQRTTRSHR